MSDRKLRKLVMSALLAALTCVATLVVQIPSPMQGYVNLGDCFVLLSGWLLGSLYGAAAGGIGSMLADLISGYAFYAPGTLAVKGIMAAAAAFALRAMGNRKSSYAVGGLLAECWMVLGYFLYAALIFGEGLAAALSIPGNIVQGALGLAAGLALVATAERLHLTERFA